MAIAVAQVQENDLPHLTIRSGNRISNNSPFPSPSSAFLTPPDEDFSIQLARNMQDINPPTPQNAANLPVFDGEATPTLQPLVKGADPASNPVTPTMNVPPQSAIRASTGPIAVPINTRTVSSSSLSVSQRESLTSSRPAPPSPAVSRRTSAALSRHSSSAHSTRQSKDLEKMSSSIVSSATKRASKARSWIIKVRDFAFPPSDDRHEGRGHDVPRPNRARYRHSTLSNSSTSSTTPETTEDQDEELSRQQGWGSFRWNTLSSHFSWGKGESQQSGGPSHTDFERNFDAAGNQIEDDDSEEYQEGDEEYDYPEDGPLVPGLYRALYAFEPEGATEMALEEGQVVKIIARGGGVGWAVAEKEDGEHALVPEGYLELIEADADEQQD
ncbi:hypothetical protein BXZ70DRAFT_1061996 [Cristinia sonorae]|uniref:SH3 domain-containing protein n=1 Tax=Cristinia sonorae TaxID=1940300 RepID=A0A8K0UVV5_9AGAR|nr:hypothetical protein BXZ70DRAFT_1061996 [Cristinia sonorae]